MSQIEQKRRQIQTKAFNEGEDLINTPKHYVGKGGLEAVQVCEAFGLPFHLAQSVQYILRAGKKGGEQLETEQISDIRKAIWFLCRYAHVELRAEVNIDVNIILDSAIHGIQPSERLHVPEDGVIPPGEYEVKIHD